MTAIVGEGVTLRGLYQDAFSYTWNITGTCVAADVGKAVCQDTSVANSVKLATADSVILGSLASYENRTIEGIVVGAVYRKGVFVWTYTGADPALGQSVVGGANPGTVKGALTGGETPAAVLSPNNRIIDIDTVAKTVTVLFD